MKVTIVIKKTEPFKKLFVKTVEKEMFEKIVAKLKKDGADEDKIGKFIKENEYNGKISYQFDLMCSKQTWEAVERYAELDAKIDFGINDKDYCFARINIVDGIEQVLSYNPDPNDVTVRGWACGAIPEAKVEQVQESETAPVQETPTANDLPF